MSDVQRAAVVLSRRYTRYCVYLDLDITTHHYYAHTRHYYNHPLDVTGEPRTDSPRERRFRVRSTAELNEFNEHLSRNMFNGTALGMALWWLDRTKHLKNTWSGGGIDDDGDGSDAYKDDSVRPKLLYLGIEYDPINYDHNNNYV